MGPEDKDKDKKVLQESNRSLVEDSRGSLTGVRRDHYMKRAAVLGILQNIRSLENYVAAVAELLYWRRSFRSDSETRRRGELCNSKSNRSNIYEIGWAMAETSPNLPRTFHSDLAARGVPSHPVVRLGLSLLLLLNRHRPSRSMSSPKVRASHCSSETDQATTHVSCRALGETVDS